MAAKRPNSAILGRCSRCPRVGVAIADGLGEWRCDTCDRVGRDLTIVVARVPLDTDKDDD